MGSQSSWKMSRKQWGWLNPFELPAVSYLLALVPVFMHFLWSGPRRKRVQLRETPEP